MKRFNSATIIKLAALGIAISSSLSAYADEAKTLDAILVTANRSETRIDETLASVTVITRVDIENSQASDISDLLSQQAGLDIIRSGGTGTNVSVFTRGSSSNQTLIVLNGVRLNTSSQGNYDFSILPLAMIERVEIVRGPRAAIWGSDAIGGVIQIFTRASGEHAQLRVGSYGRAEVNVGFGLGNEEYSLAVSAGHGRASGFSATNGNYPFGPYPDDDGYEASHVLVNGKLKIGGHSLSAFATAIDANLEFDEGQTRRKTREAGVVLAGNINDVWRHSLSVGHTYEYLSTPVYGSLFGNRRLAVDWINTLDLNEQNRVNVGVNWSQENSTSEEFGITAIDRNRRNTGIFAAWHGQFASNSFELAARHDDNSQFNAKTTLQAAWGLKISDDLRLRASWGQGFRAPNFNELYYPGFFGFYAGNANLKPESSHTAELGVNFSIDSRQTMEVSAYHTKVKDLIVFKLPPFYTADNVDRARLKGLEVQYRFTGELFSLSANAGWQDARDLEFDTKLLRRADRKLNINTDFKISEQWKWGLDFQAASQRPDFSDPTPGYGRLDARLGYQFAAGWNLEARIENLGDKDYELVPGYNTPGRSGLLSLRWNGKN